MDGVENLEVTADSNAPLAFDLSGTEGLERVITKNSTGDVSFNRITTDASVMPLTVDVRNLTQDADVTVDFMASAVDGDSDAINVELNNSFDANVGTLGIDSGIEIVNISTSGAPTSINVLLDAAGAGQVNIGGDQDLFINELGTSADTVVDASGLAADLTVGVPMTNVDEYYGAQGDDSVSFEGSTKNMIIEANDGDDVVTSGDGDDTIDMGDGADVLNLSVGLKDVDMGSGDDSVFMNASTLTIGDEIDGGTGVDTLNFTDDADLGVSETANVNGFEVINIFNSGTNLLVTDHLVETAEGGLTINMGDDGNDTVDLTELAFGSTSSLTVNGGASMDVVVADDETLNGGATIAFGQDSVGLGDTLRIENGATVTVDDFAGISGMDRIELVSDNAQPQVWSLDLDGVAIDDDGLDIFVSPLIESGSVLNIDGAALGTKAVTVWENENVTVNVTNGANVTVRNSFEFTENQDELIGGAGYDLFHASSLDQIQDGDEANGNGGWDHLVLDFRTTQTDNTILQQLDDPNIWNIEELTFNTNKNVEFSSASDFYNGGLEVVNTGGGDDTIGTAGGTGMTINMNGGDDSVTGGSHSATYNLGEGDNYYRSASYDGDSETITSGSGDDSFVFDVHELWNNDSITAGLGDDTLSLDTSGSDWYVYNLPNVLSGVDTVNYYVDNDDDAGIRIDNADAAQADDQLTVNVTDGNDQDNNVAIFGASAVTSDHDLIVNVYSDKGGDEGITGADTNLDNDSPDVIGGAGNDDIYIGYGLESYVVQGNAGADEISIGSNYAVGIRYETGNNGGTSGAETGYDVITGFNDGDSDYILFDHDGFASTDGFGFGATGAGGDLDMAVDTQADFTANILGFRDNGLLLTQIGNGLSDADLTDLQVIADRINDTGVDAQGADSGVIVVQGVSQSAIYLYTENNGVDNNVATSELKILGIVDANDLGDDALDLQYAIS
jgi:hypothetical protein